MTDERPNAAGVYPGIVLDVPARDLAAARGFYEGVFGWRFDADPKYLEWPEFTDGVTRGSLFAGDGSDIWPLVAYRVVDIDRKIAEVVAAGGSVARPKWTLASGSGVIVHDLSGNRIGLWQDAC